MSLPKVVFKKKQMFHERKLRKKNYKLGKIEKIKEDDGGYHITTTEGIDYKWRFFCINGWMEHNMAWYIKYYTFFRKT